MHRFLIVSQRRLKIVKEFLKWFNSVNCVKAASRLSEISSSHVKYHTILSSVMDIFIDLKSPT